MTPGCVIGVSMCIFLGRLAFESALLAHAKRRVPLRICVTGTRGKSSVTRLIAAGLRAGGRNVVAKATGTEAVLIASDGSEAPLKRRGKPSILEQSKLLRRAARMGAQAVVFEVMSIRPETQFTETERILEPSILALTNVRHDHLSDLSSTISDVAGMLALSVPRGGVVLTPIEEVAPEIEFACRSAKARLVACTPLEIKPADFLAYEEFESNLRLALAVCAEVGVPRDIALEGMRTSRPDPGHLVLSRRDSGEKRLAFCVSAFAANDPESTIAVLEKTKNAEEGRAVIQGSTPLAKVGVLNVRKDRGDRTLQWIEWLDRRNKSKEPPLFDRIFVIGDPCHGRAAAYKLRKSGLNARYDSCRDPESFTRQACGEGSSCVLLFGFGNIAGKGRILADYWSSSTEASA